MQVFGYSAFDFEGTHLTRVEIDQRSRATRRHLEQVKELLVPQIQPTRSLLSQALYRLHLGIQPVAISEPTCADP
jgi:hypothetical protein